MKAWRSLLLVATVMAGCSPSPERLADRFVDLYFLESDQGRARELATGLAAKKLDDELQLVEKIRQSYQASEARPSVAYHRRAVQLAGDHAFVTYELTLGREQKQVMVSLELGTSDQRWHVANFVVSDSSSLPARPSPDR